MIAGGEPGGMAAKTRRAASAGARFVARSAESAIIARMNISAKNA
jgi:hypothetical protein